MKHNFSFKVAAIFFSLLLGLSSCSKDDTPKDNEGVTGVVSFTLQRDHANQSAEMGTKSVVPADLTYVIEAWSNEASPKCLFHKSYPGSSLVSGSIDINLVPGSYDLLFWADYGNGSYNTASLRAIKVKTPYEYSATSVLNRDAFAGVLRGVNWTSGVNINVTLRRPLAKITLKNATPFTTSNQAQISFTNMVTEYDLLAGESKGYENVTVKFGATVVGNSLVGEDFVFVPSDPLKQTSVEMTVGNVSKKLSPIDIKENYVTNVTAQFENK